jgi:hypothetical protein
MARGNAQAHACRQLRDGQAPILLEHGKDFPGHGVHGVNSSTNWASTGQYFETLSGYSRIFFS